MARLPNFLVIIRSEKLSGKGQGRGVGVRKKERFVLGKRTFRSQKSKHFVLRIINNPKVDEREITLSFTIEGNSQSDYQAKKKAFFDELYKGVVDIQVPANSNEIYHLIYLGKSVAYAQSLDRTFGKISAKFNEPNPANRS